MSEEHLAYRSAIAKWSLPITSNRSNVTKIDLSLMPSAITYDFKQVAVGVKKIDAIVVAPVDWLRRFHASLRELGTCTKKIFAADAESMMALAQRMGNPGGALRGRQGRADDVEKSEILITALHQDLITEARDHTQSEDPSVKALGAGEISHVETEMIEALELHRNP